MILVAATPTVAEFRRCLCRLKAESLRNEEEAAQEIETSGHSGPS